MKRSLKRLPHLGALLFVLAAAPAHVAAQDPAPPAAGEQAGTADALRRLKPGTLLRVHTSTAGRVEGPLVRVTPEALVVGVAGGERILPLADLRSVWARGRQTRRGAKLGAVAGGVGGLVFSGFIAALASAEGEDSGDIGQFVLGSTALSAAGGALVGGIAGAAFPRWRRVVGTGSEDEPSGDESLGTVPEGGRRFASVETTLGFARTEQDGGTGGGPAGRIAILGEFDLGRAGQGTRPFLTVGLEGGTQRLGTTPPRPTPTVVFTGGQTRLDTVPVRRRYEVRDVGGVVRAGVESRGIQPYGLLGIGADQRRVTSLTDDGGEGVQDNYVAGYAAGAGLQLRPARRRLSGGVEGRWHSNLFPGQSDGVDQAFGFWTVGATLNMRW